MNILVLSGSPKGEYSVTLQTVRYLEKCYPAHTFDVLHVGQRIASLEKNMEEAVSRAQRADLLLFCYPVYTFIAPYQMHRFMELLKTSGVCLAGRYATQITTSKHFYDVTAHRYIEDNCHDLGLRVIRGLSADMDDLLSEKGRREAREFFAFVLHSMQRELYEPAPVCAAPRARRPVSAAQETQKQDGDVVIVCDLADGDAQLAAMIDRFRAVFPIRTRVVNIREYPFKSGCLGCFGCAVSGKCVVKDGFDDFLREDVQRAQAIVYAFTIRDHSMGARFKLYDDRQFCNGHRTVTMGMPFGYLVSGGYSAEYNLQTIIEARAQVGGNYLAGVATDETDPDREIGVMAEKLFYAVGSRYAPPQNFYGVGGMKIFRDLIWIMQGMMKADHRFYKAHGQYDFPQKQWKTMLKMQLVGLLLASPAVKKKMGNAMNEGMIAPYKKILNSAEPLD